MECEFYSEFYEDKTGEIILVTRYVPDEKENLIRMYENFDVERRCCGLPPVGRRAIESWIDYLDSRGYSFIGKLGDKVIGHITVVPENDGAEFAIFVHQDYEDRGIGGELIRFAEKFLLDKGIKKLNAMTERTNRRALEIYRHLGFQIVKTDNQHVYLEKILDED